MAAMQDVATHRAIDAVWRIESTRLIAGLVRMVRSNQRASATTPTLDEAQRAKAQSLLQDTDKLP